MSKKEEHEVLQKAIDTWGILSQVMMVFEECGELISILAKAHRGRAENNAAIITEIADVSIMVEQMALYFGYDEYLAERERKLERLKERLNK